VVSVRINRDVLKQLNELAAEMDRGRSYLITQAIREFLEREYASLSAIREAERDLAAGKGIRHGQVSALVNDLIAGKSRPKAFR
jgi:predicted transcriptional regulator